MPTPWLVRAWVMGRIPAHEELLNLGDVQRCEASFLTNSRIGIRNVAELDGRPLLLDDAGLQKRYREEVIGS